MQTHGTATDGQLAEFLGAGVKALALSSRSLEPKRLEYWSRNGAELEKRFIQALALPGTDEPLPVPALDEWFDLGINYDADPMDAVRAVGVDSREWQYLGPEFTGNGTIQAKLVRLGYCQNLEEAQRKADALGFRLLAGQARESFKKRFQRNDGNGPIVFGGSQWQNPDGVAGVACLGVVGGEWDSDFGWAKNGWSGGWRWAVVRK